MPHMPAPPIMSCIMADRLLLVVVLILAAAALIKYLIKG
jgi:hypothetical protein